MTVVRFTKAEMAQQAAQSIPAGSYVNLGIGLPELVADHIDPASAIMLHSENGILGMGPGPSPADTDWELINAGKKPVTLVAGGAFFHHGDSFAMIRGGHIDICVMGAFQVSVGGDLANWDDGSPDAIPAVGGAMDLAVGARSIFVMMTLFNSQGQSKLVEKLTAPVTAMGVVTRLFTDHGCFDLGASGVRAVALAPGVSAELIKQRCQIELAI